MMIATGFPSSRSKTPGDAPPPKPVPASPAGATRVASVGMKTYLSRFGLATAFLLLGAASARAQNLATFLREASSAAQMAAPVRGDGTLVFKTPDGENRDQVFIALRPPQDLYLELRKTGTRVLLLRDGAAAYLVEKESAPVVEATKSTLVPGTNFTIEELRPFNIEDYASPRIADQEADEIMVAMDPKQSQYVLTVATFDRAKRVPIKMQYYKDSPSNLFKMRRDGGYATVAERWLPETIALDQFALRTSTEMTLHWQAAADLAKGLFDPAALRKPSGIHWPDLPAAQ
jgi:Outer membrane lipoprotein-sorting protein